MVSVSCCPSRLKFSRERPGVLLLPALRMPGGLRMTAALAAFLSQSASSHVPRHLGPAWCPCPQDGPQAATRDAPG